jgi:hypothetical protein
MLTDTALVEKREEIKRRLTEGEYKTLVDVSLEWIDRLIRKIVRRSTLVPTWVLIASLGFITTLVGLSTIFIAGDWSNLIKIGSLIGLNEGLVIPWVISNYVFYIISAVAINQYLHRILFFWRENILDATESRVNLEQFENWLEKVQGWRSHLFVSIIGSLFAVSFLVAIIDAKVGKFIGYSLTFLCAIPSTFALSFLYQFLLVILLSSSLRRYDLKLFAADPSSSELISRLSFILSLGIYLVASYASIATLSAAPTGFIPAAGIILISVLWLPLIFIFILNQTSLSSIIRRAKWKTLKEIQAKVETLQAKRNFEDKETMDSINRLMDYHDRVKATRDSALDFRAYLNFLNSLLLPLLAFVLGNLNTILTLFKKQH